MADRRAARPPALQCATSEARPSIKHNHEALQDSQLTASKEAQATATQTEGSLVVRIGVYLQDSAAFDRWVSDRVDHVDLGTWVRGPGGTWMHTILS